MFFYDLIWQHTKIIKFAVNIKKQKSSKIFYKVSSKVSLGKSGKNIWALPTDVIS